MSPVRKLLVSDGIIVWIIAVEGQHDFSGGIIWNGQVLEIVGTCGISGNAQPAGFVIASGSTNCIHKHLIPLVNHVAALLIVLFGRPLIAINKLIEGLQHQEVALVLELVCNLGPDSRDFRLHLLVHLFAVHCALEVLPVIAVILSMVFIMVGVKDNIQSGILCKSYDLINAVEPFLVKGIVGGLSYMSHPGGRDTDAGEAFGLEPVESGLRGRFPLPGSLRCNTVRVCIEMVAHVPAKTQFQRTGNGSVSRQFGVLYNLARGLGHGNLDVRHSGSR